MIVEIVLGLLLIVFLWRLNKKPPNYPPGYWGLPLIGYVPLSGTLQDNLQKLRKEHGDVVMWRMGSRLMVYVFDYKLLKEILNKNEFIDRPDFKLFQLISEDHRNCGLVANNGIAWHNGRRFSLRLLRDLGMGKSRLVTAIQGEASDLVQELKKIAGKPQPLPHSLVVAVINVLWQMMASKKFALDDPELIGFEELILYLSKYVHYIALQDFLLWLPYVMPNFLLRKLTKLDLYDEFRSKYKIFFEKQIEEHEATPDLDDPKDYIDYYLREMKKQENDPDSTMSQMDLLTCLGDLFNAGSETSKVTLTWAIFYLASNQDVQKRLQDEVDTVLPKGTLATMEDKAKLPYTEAVMHEVMRLSSLVALGVMRSATRDVDVGGYTIPKGSILNPVFVASHHDPEVWESPLEFRPERFLNSENQFVNPKESFIPFGSGKRQCLGESLARMQLFIFLTTLVQSLHFSPPPGKTLDLIPHSGNPIVNEPKQKQDILITIR